MAKYNFDEYGQLDMISYNKIEKEINKQISDFVNDIFYKYQTELEIEDGDIGFDNEFEIECGTEDLTRAIVDSLNYQLETKAMIENETEED